MAGRRCGCRQLQPASGPCRPRSPEPRRRRARLRALILAIASFSVGVAFAIGVGASLLATAGDRRRLWIPLIPLALFAVWWIWALQFDEGNQSLANALLSPGLGARLAGRRRRGADRRRSRPHGVVPAAVGRDRLGTDRRRLRWSSWRSSGSGGAAHRRCFGPESCSCSRSGSPRRSPTARLPLTRRTPDLDRYAYPVAIGIVLVLAASFRGWRPSGRDARRSSPSPCSRCR